jgi:hypothetical protein
MGGNTFESGSNVGSAFNHSVEIGKGDAGIRN